MPAQPNGQHQTQMILSAMADYYDRVVRELGEFGERTKWAEGDDSPYALERSNLIRQFGPGGAWDEADAEHARRIVFVHLISGARYLTGISLLLRNCEMLCLAPLIRSVFELSGRVAWVLDPRIRVRDRSARIFLCRLEDLTRAKAAAKSLSHPELVHYGHAARALRRDFLDKRFYPSEIVRDEGGGLSIRGQKMPGLRQSLDILDEVHQNVDWTSAGVYDYLSNVAHPTPHAAVEHFVFTHDVERSVLRWNLNLEDAAYPYRVSRAGVLSILDMWKLFVSYLGIESQAIEELGVSIDALPEPS